MDDMTDVKSAVDSIDFTTNPIIQKLNELSITHNTYGHTLSMTADELVTNAPLPDNANETHTKNLFFKDKKHGMFLVVTCTDAECNTKELGKMLKLEGKTNLRLADEKLLLESWAVICCTAAGLSLKRSYARRLIFTSLSSSLLLAQLFGLLIFPFLCQ